MDIILVPGLWLDASSWDGVVPTLERAGHVTHPLTMPGVGADGEAARGITIDDWVAATVDAIDRVDGPVVLVGHSGGGNVVYGALDARPERVAQVVFLDTFPPGDGQTIWEFPVVDGVIPFPGWDFFEEGEVADLDAATRAAASERTLSVPELVPTSPLRLRDERRRVVPATMITGTVPEAEIRGIIEAAPEWAAELASLADLRIIQLNAPGEPTGHWPQLAKPERVGAAILDAIA